MPAFQKHMYAAALLLSFAVFLVHTNALRRSLYWSLPWLDIPMHLAGGFLVALLAALVLSAGGGVGRGEAGASAGARGRRALLFSALGAPLGVGILWELFEHVAGISFAAEGIYLDTALDLIMDFAGGALAYGYLRSLLSGSASGMTSIARAGGRYLP